MNGLKSVNSIVEKGVSCEVHCSDGWDRTSQLVGLAELMLDPYYRSLRGFIILVEKEWLSFGHQFNVRNGQEGNGDARSPIFLQFCDCVFQLTSQFPNSFEFNQELLIMMVDASYNGLFGTFLKDCSRLRIQEDIQRKTVSVWSFVLANVDRYTNPFYIDPKKEGRWSLAADVLIPNCHGAKMVFWERLYLRSDKDMFPKGGEVSASDRMEMLLEHIKHLERKNERLHEQMRQMKEKEGQGSLLESEDSISMMSRGQSYLVRDNRKRIDIHGLTKPQTATTQRKRKENSNMDEEGRQEGMFEGHGNGDEGREREGWMEEGMGTGMGMGRKELDGEEAIDVIQALLWESVDCPFPIGTEGGTGTGGVNGPERPGALWVRDQDVLQCDRCHQDFTLFRRKHHCRVCGNIFCDACSSNRRMVPWNGDPVRVCDGCIHARLNESVE
eukprot:TRINITY_DN14787_c0_g1_i3.p1 TRINITY_DN14787_c0_g1~~TRINITY_DN14787_c0_g1_i3.p1  ORF type:complete len:442 (-),score=127.90 TRINITY_DN14787_c0_g1_i3:79-1404(-)